MYFDDHGHPHFHARHGGREAKIRFDEIAVIDSALDVRQLRLVLAWAELTGKSCWRTGVSHGRVRH